VRKADPRDDLKLAQVVEELVGLPMAMAQSCGWSQSRNDVRWKLAPGGMARQRKSTDLGVACIIHERLLCNCRCSGERYGGQRLAVVTRKVFPSRLEPLAGFLCDCDEPS